MSLSQLGLLRMCALSVLWSAQRVPRALPQSPAGRYEVPVATPDGKVVGRIDELVSSPTSTVVREYKSGAIYRESLFGQSTLKG